jgi:hypothetical protein
MMQTWKKELMERAGFVAPELACRASALADIILEAVLEVVDQQRDPPTLNYSPKARLREAILLKFPE